MNYYDIKSLANFYIRRAERMEERGIRMDSKTNYDASARLAYGIAKSLGIKTEGMSPKEVWEAIADKDPKAYAQAKGGKGKAKAEPKGGKTAKNSERFIGGEKASKAAEVGGYKRQNKLKNGYGVAFVEQKDKNSDAGETVRANQDKNGNWNEKSLALHSKYVDAQLKGKTPVKGKATCTFLGGGPSSGKTYTLNHYADDLGIDVKNAVTSNPDDAKTFLPEYDPDNPSPCHEESSGMSKQLNKAALENNYNLIIDGTGDGSVKKMKKKIAEAKAAGHEVNGFYVFRPVEEALKGNYERDRTVDPQEVVKTHKAVTDILPQVASDFDNVKLFANVGGKLTLIAEGGNGKGLEAKDKKLYQQFLDNGKGWLEGESDDEFDAKCDKIKATAKPKKPRTKEVKPHKR